MDEKFLEYKGIFDQWYGNEMEFDYKDPNTGEIKTDKGGNRWWQEENEKYIIDLMNSGEYTPDEWADLVGKYAQYSIGKNRDRNDGVYQGRFDKTLTEGKRDVTEKNSLWDKLVRAVGGENPDVSGVKKSDKKWQLPTLASKDSSIANKTLNLPSPGGIINEYNKKQQSNKVVKKAATKTAKSVEKAATKGATNAIKNTVDKVVSEALKNKEVKKAVKTETKSKKIASTSKKLTQQAKKRAASEKKKTTAAKNSKSKNKAKGKTTTKKTSTSSKSKKTAKKKKK